MQTDDRGTRLLALAVITLIFITSMTALIYWAVNIASPRIRSSISVNNRSKNPLVANSAVAQLVGLATRFRS